MGQSWHWIQLKKLDDEPKQTLKKYGSWTEVSVGICLDLLTYFCIQMSSEIIDKFPCLSLLFLTINQVLLSKTFLSFVFCYSPVISKYWQYYLTPNYLHIERGIKRVDEHILSLLQLIVLIRIPFQISSYRKLDMTISITRWIGNQHLCWTSVF